MFYNCQTASKYDVWAILGNFFYQQLKIVHQEMDLHFTIVCFKKSMGKKEDKLSKRKNMNISNVRREMSSVRNGSLEGYFSHDSACRLIQP